jgi:hypothetical protein
MRILAYRERHHVHLSFRYDAGLVDLVRSMPDRTWNPDDKHWTIPAVDLDEFIQKAKSLGHQVQVIGENDSHRGPSTNGSADWAGTLFAAVGTDRAQSVYRALSKVLHPDVGGDTKLMQQLSEAYERWDKRR